MHSATAAVNDAHKLHYLGDRQGPEMGALGSLKDCLPALWSIYSSAETSRGSFKGGKNSHPRGRECRQGERRTEIQVRDRSGVLYAVIPGLTSVEVLLVCRRISRR